MHTPSPSPATRSIDAQGFFTSLRAALAGAEFDYTRGNLTRAIWLLAIPMVLEMAMESLFAVVDLYFVGQLGKAAVAAVGLTEAMLTIVYAVGLGLAMSTSAMVSRRIGEGDALAAGVAAKQAIALVLLIGVTLGAGCVFAAPWLLEQMSGSAEVVAVGSGYCQMVLGSQVVVLLLFVQNAILRGAGDAMLAMKTLWLANLLNCVLDPLFIFGVGSLPGLGVTGAGVATVIGRGVGVLYQWHALRVRADGRAKSRIAVRGSLRELDPRAMLTLLRLSVFGIGQFLIATASWVWLNKIAAWFGEAALAGYTVGVRILVFTYLPAWGLANAVATLVGQNLGAGDPARAERAVWRAALYNALFMSGFGVALWLGAEVYVGWFSDDPAVRQVGVTCLRVFSYGYPMYALGMVMVQAFNGAGDTATPTWINAVGYWAVQIPLAYLLAEPLAFGVEGVFWSVVAAESLIAAIAWAVFRRGAWRERKV